MDDISESDDDVIYHLEDPLLNLRLKIIERLSVYNYLKICINVAWLVDGALLEGATTTEKITLGVLVLDGITELRQMRSINYSMMENIYSLAEHPDRLTRLRKRVGWFQWMASFIH
jgi:hypothetical protein